MSCHRENIALDIAIIISFIKKVFLVDALINLQKRLKILDYLICFILVLISYPKYISNIYLIKTKYRLIDKRKETHLFLKYLVYSSLFFSI